MRIARANARCSEGTVCAVRFNLAAVLVQSPAESRAAARYGKQGSEDEQEDGTATSGGFYGTKSR